MSEKIIKAIGTILVLFILLSIFYSVGYYTLDRHECDKWIGDKYSKSYIPCPTEVAHKYLAPLVMGFVISIAIMMFLLLVSSIIAGAYLLVDSLYNKLKKRGK